ncbi:MAG: hypothetical protein OEY49_08855 [Candidatus Heimdallarchaeota archaeon]|nr:hypothetical protein [Candidatus Heimdallarchaeota archaeon]
MSIKDSIARNYIFFRHPSHLILVLLPTFTGLVQYFFFNSGKEVIINPKDEIYSSQYQMINEYLLFTDIVIVLLLSLFVVYRWTIIKKDGSYGFWLTQGIKRERIFLITVWSFFLDFYIVKILGFIIVFTIGGLYLPASQLFLLLTLSALNLLILIFVSFLVSNQIGNPEFGSLVLIVLFGVNITFNTNRQNSWFLIFNGQYLYNEESGFFALIILVISNLLLFFVNRYIQFKEDIEL